MSSAKSQITMPDPGPGRYRITWGYVTGREVWHYGEPVFHDDGSVTIEGTTSEWVTEHSKPVGIKVVEIPGKS